MTSMSTTAPSTAISSGFARSSAPSTKASRQSKRSMASATDSPKNSDDLSLKWSGRWSLTTRILAVNIFAVAMLAGSIYYLDIFRERMTVERLEQIGISTQYAAAALAAAPPQSRLALAAQLGKANQSRIRLYDDEGRLALDSWSLTGETYRLRDPAREPLRKHAARLLDRAIDIVAAAEDLPPLDEPAVDTIAAWPEARAARASSKVTRNLRNAPDRTPMVSAAMRLPDGSDSVLLMSASAREVTRQFRAERFTSAVVLAVVISASILLSLFLARTIVRPLRRLAIAAQRVRAGRAREGIGRAHV